MKAMLMLTASVFALGLFATPAYPAAQSCYDIFGTGFCPDELTGDHDPARAGGGPYRSTPDNPPGDGDGDNEPDPCEHDGPYGNKGGWDHNDEGGDY